MDQSYSIWQMNSGQASGNAGGSSVIAAPPGRHLRVINIRSQGVSPARLIETVASTGTGSTVFGSGTSDIYQQQSTTVMTEPLLLQIPETRQYLVDESLIQNIDQMPPVNLIMGTSGDACDESSVVASSDGDQVFHLTTEPATMESTIMQPNDNNSCVHGHYAEECEVMEEVITDDWVQSQGEECVQVTVDQLGASTIAGAVEDDISVPLDQDEYTLSRPFPCDFCSRRFRKKASLQNHLIAHSNDRPHVCNLCGAQYGRRIDLTNHFKQHAYEASNLDEGAQRSDQEGDYDIPGLAHQGKQRLQQSSEDEDLFSEGTRAVSYNAQPPMQLISSRNSTATSGYARKAGVRLQYSNEQTVDTMNPILEDGFYSYASPPIGESRSGSSRKAPPSSKRQVSRGGKTAPTTTGKGNNRKNAASSSNINNLTFLDPTNEEAAMPAPLSFPVVDERKPFVCQLCGASFGREKALASHFRIHGGDMHYQCSTCSESFWDRELLQDHIRQKHPNVFCRLPPEHGGSKRTPKVVPSVKSSSVVAKDGMSTQDRRFPALPSDGQYLCESCHMTFNRPEYLEKHIQEAHSSSTATGACSRTTDANRMIVKQEPCELFDMPNGQTRDKPDVQYATDVEGAPNRGERSSTLYCRDCHLTFTKRAELQAHCCKEHTRVEPHECQLCGEKFPNESVIKQHVQECHRAELTDSSCAICGKLCKNQTSLMKHSYDHSRERAHCCSICGKTFHHMGRLKRHMGSHRSRTVQCEVCGEEFPDGRTLMNHRHSHSKSNNYPCKECGKTFGSRSSQQIHLRIHTGERPYACRFCWKAFADGGTLRKHERVHTGEKPYGCSVCPKEFNQRVVLREHIRAHHSQPDAVQGSADLPYYCPVCSMLFSTSVDLVQHLIEHSDSNTAKKRKPPIFPRKYKRRRKLKPQELERLLSGRRKQKTKNAADVVEEQEGGASIDDEEADEGSDPHCEQSMKLMRDDGTFKTSAELFLEYGDSSKVQQLAVASPKFISPYELLADETVKGSIGGGRARKKSKPAEGMLHDLGINLLSNEQVQPQNKPPPVALLGSSKLGHDDRREAVGKRKSVRSGATLPSKPSTAITNARMIRTEPTSKRSKVTAKKGKKQTATAANSTKKLAPTGEDTSFVGPPEISSVSHAMEAFSELERKRSRTRPMPSYVREIPSSKISENFPLLDDGDTEDTMEEPLMEGCSPDYRSSRQRYVSSTSTVSVTREEEDEQLLMEISRGEKYTDRFNSDIVNDLAEILRSPVKGASGAPTSTIPPVDILASPTNRHAVQLPLIKTKASATAAAAAAAAATVGKRSGQKKQTAATNRSQSKAKAPKSAASTRQSTYATTTTTASVAQDPYTNSLLYSHGRRLTRRQLEREVSFLSEAYAPETTHPEASNDTREDTPEALPAFSTIGEERAIVIKLEESVNVPEKLAAMLLNDGIPTGADMGRCGPSEQQKSVSDYTVDGEIERHSGHAEAEQATGTTVRVSSKSTTSLSNGYRCSICTAFFTDRSQLILHVPVHM